MAKIGRGGRDGVVVVKPGTRRAIYLGMCVLKTGEYE